MSALIQAHGLIHPALCLGFPSRMLPHSNPVLQAEHHCAFLGHRIEILVVWSKQLIVVGVVIAARTCALVSNVRFVVVFLLGIRVIVKGKHALLFQRSGRNG